MRARGRFPCQPFSMATNRRVVGSLEAQFPAKTARTIGQAARLSIQRPKRQAFADCPGVSGTNAEDVHWDPHPASPGDLIHRSSADAGSSDAPSGSGSRSGRQGAAAPDASRGTRIRSVRGADTDVSGRSRFRPRAEGLWCPALQEAITSHGQRIVKSRRLVGEMTLRYGKLRVQKGYSARSLVISRGRGPIGRAGPVKMSGGRPTPAVAWTRGVAES